MSTNFPDALAEHFRAVIEAVVKSAVEEQLVGLDTRAQLQLPGDIKPLLTIDEVAEYLKLGTKGPDGKRPGGVRTIRQWVKDGSIPYRKAGDRVLFDQAEVDAWTREGAANDRLRRTPRIP